MWIYEDKNGFSRGLSDYKFFVFDGKVRFFYITYDRGKDTGTCIDVYDMNLNKIPVQWGYQNSNYEFIKPRNFERMVELAEILGRDSPHIRVDFYNVNGEIYFGELTLYTWSGFVPLIPEDWNYEFGNYIDLDRVKRGYSDAN